MQKAPDPAPVVLQPDPADPRKKAKNRRKVAEKNEQGGRQSTLLSGGYMNRESLG